MLPAEDQGQAATDARASNRAAEPERTEPDAPRAPAARTGPGTFLPSISAAGGGGTIKGLGETFSTSLSTGSVSVVVAIAASTGRDGFELGLQLIYDSGSGNSPWGIGWSTSVPSITRETDRGIPRYGPDDTFILAGAEHLVPAPPPGSAQDGWTQGEFDVQTYRPRVDSAYSRIERWTNRYDGDVHWRVRSRENTLSIFGASAETRIVDPDDPKRVYSWLLEEVRDGRGNVVRYVYAAETESGPGGAPPAQRYLKRAQYGNRVPGVAGDWLFEVVFDYGDHDAGETGLDPNTPWPRRRDPFSTHRPGFCLTTLRLCRRALLFHHFDELGPRPFLVKSTVFTYDERPTITRLTRIEHVGHMPDGSGGHTSKRLPPLEFEYTEPAPLSADPWKPIAGLPAEVRPDSEWADLDGRGLPDLLIERKGAWYRARNLGSGRFSFAALEPALPAGATREDTVLVDRRTGRLDAARLGGSGLGYWPRNRQGGFDAFRPFRSVPTIGVRGPGIHTLDADADGVGLDLLTERDGHIYCYLFKDDGFAPAIREPSRLSALPLFHSQDGTAFQADMSGDGLTDEVRISASGLTYTPLPGYARTGRPVSIDFPEPLDGGEGFDPRRIRLADADGCGTDILYLRRDGQIAVFRSESANAFSQPVFISPPTDEQGSHGDVRALDLLGHGTTCLVWFPADASKRRQPRYCDLYGGSKPHLLKTVRNNFGGEIKVTYGFSTEEMLRDEARDRPWLTTLPNPVPVVKEVRRVDHVARAELCSRYEYRNGHYLSADREFSGFAYVQEEQVDAFGGTLADVGYRKQPPTITRTWFHSGAYLESEQLEAALAAEYWSGDTAATLLPDTVLPPGLSLQEEREAARALRGRELRREIYSPDGSDLETNPYQVHEKAYAVRRCPASAGAVHAVFDVQPTESLQYQYERVANDPRITHELVLGVDDYGGVTQAASVAYPRRAWTESEQGRLWATVSETRYTTHTSLNEYRIRVVYDEETTELAGLKVRSGESRVTADDVRHALHTANAVPFESRTSRDTLEKRPLRHRFVLYRTEDGIGTYPLGAVGPLALIHEEYQFALTPGLVSTAYGAEVGPAELASAGYVEGPLGWYVPSGVPTYDPNHFFLTTGYVDPHGNPYSVEYDRYALLPVKTTDPVKNTVVATQLDYCTLKPRALADPNGDITEVAFDELGAVRSLWRFGQHDDGDDRDHPGSVFEYDLEAYVEGRGPVFSEALARVRFRAGSPFRDEFGRPNHRDWIQVRTFTDGFGRKAMLKVQAEPDADRPRWAVTGWTVYENKHGKPARQYEPRFSDNEDFEFEAGGGARVFLYDPLGRLVRQEYPDGTLCRIRLDAWREEHWDQNDTVLESTWLTENLAGTDAERRAAQLAIEHANTPEVRHLDALGRPFLKVADADAAGLRPTHTEFDVVGNVRAITDARLVRCLSIQPDALDRPIISDSADAGKRTVLPDIHGQPLLSSDARQYRVRRDYDELRRPTRLSVRAPGEATEVLAMRTVYGEHAGEPEFNRLRGRSHATYDGGGASVVGSYGLLGGIATVTRTLSARYDAASNWAIARDHEDAAAVAAASGPQLEGTAYTTRFEYDALGRVTLQRTPDGSETLPAYNEANLLNAITVRLPEIRNALGVVALPATAPTVLVNVDYNARGQRTRVEHGNGVVTAYTYDATTFRLIRQVASRPGGTLLEDLAATYDPVGNLVEIEDAVSYGNSRVPGGRRYEYDALYQLTLATGREHPGLQPRDDNPYGPPPGHPNDLQAITNYRETFAYDPSGNLFELVHREERPDGSLRTWRRDYTYAADSNRLLTTATGNGIATPPLSYSHDANGNMSLPHLVGMDWNWADQLEHVSRQAWNPPSPGAPFNDVYFRYDATGQRVRKAYAHGGYVEEWICLGALEIYQKRPVAGGAAAFRRTTLHVMDGGRRVALIETNDEDTSAPGVFVARRRSRYQLADLLETATVEVAEDGQNVISYEETYAYGESSVWIEQSSPGFSLKRWRYCAKERDEETGLYYYGARYYSTLGRWLSPDPSGLSDGLNVYAYARNAPSRYIDPDGTQTSTPEEEALQASVIGGETVGPGPEAICLGSDASNQTPATATAPEDPDWINAGEKAMELMKERASSKDDKVNPPYALTGSGLANDVGTRGKLKGKPVFKPAKGLEIAPTGTIGCSIASYNSLVEALGGELGGEAIKESADMAEVYKTWQLFSDQYPVNKDATDWAAGVKAKGSVDTLVAHNMAVELTQDDINRGDLYQTQGEKFAGHSGWLVDVKRDNSGKIVQITDVSANVPAGSAAIKIRTLEGKKLDNFLNSAYFARLTVQVYRTNPKLQRSAQ